MSLKFKQKFNSGETPLHLAARFSKTEAAKHLLEAGGEPNAQDCNGRTPLHAAVAADAKGVFMVRKKNDIPMLVE